MNLDLDQLIADTTLRKMDHTTWLLQLAITFEIANEKRAAAGREVSPLQLGMINRLKLAVKYIELLQREARDDQKMIAALQLELDDLKQVEDGR